MEDLPKLLQKYPVVHEHVNKKRRETAKWTTDDLLHDEKSRQWRVPDSTRALLQFEQWYNVIFLISKIIAPTKLKKKFFNLMTIFL